MASLTLSDFVETVVDIGTTQLASAYVVPKVTGLPSAINIKTSALFHIADEIVLPIVMKKVGDLLEYIPGFGKKAQMYYDQAMNITYVQALIRIVLIMLAQKLTGQPVDAIKGAIMFLSSAVVDLAAEIKVVEDVLDQPIADYIDFGE